jgi:hypothetical protein
MTKIFAASLQATCPNLGALIGARSVHLTLRSETFAGILSQLASGVALSPRPPIT